MAGMDRKSDKQPAKGSTRNPYTNPSPLSKDTPRNPYTNRENGSDSTHRGTPKEKL